MKNLIIAFVLTVGPTLLQAHNPLSSRYYLQAGAQGSVLTINLSQQGVDHFMSEQYGEEAMKGMSRQDYKEAIVKYIKDHFSLSLDGDDLQLGQGGIKLGSHQTDLKFVLSPMSFPVKDISVSIRAFLENDHHQTIFSYNFEGITGMTILNEHNEYEADITIGDVQPIKAQTYALATGLLIITVAGLTIRLRSQTI